MDYPGPRRDRMVRAITLAFNAWQVAPSEFMPSRRLRAIFLGIALLSVTGCVTRTIVEKATVVVTQPVPPNVTIVTRSVDHSVEVTRVVTKVVTATPPETVTVRSSQTSTPSPTPVASWPFAGNNLQNTRRADAERLISTSTVSALSPKWVFRTTGDVSATPAYDQGDIFVPDWGGVLYKIKADSGVALWSHKVADYDGVRGAISRTTPAVGPKRIYIGDLDGGHVMAIDKATGDLLWITQVDSHPAAEITQSPVLADGRLYVGVSSKEEGYANSANYHCCTFRGSIVALDASTGQILWKTYTVPAGYSGGAVWGSTAVVDRQRDLLYLTTGNNYSVPSGVMTCINNLGLASSTDCLTPNDYFDSVLALNLQTGDVVWARRLQGFDAWTQACLNGVPGVTWCPSPDGPDYDFGSGPNLFSTTIDGTKQQLLGVGQKSGVYWALDPATGDVVWHTLVGPGGGLGGILWGSATDGTRIYVAIANSDHSPYTLEPSGRRVTGSSWSALDAGTGKILWQVADPAQHAVDTGSVTVANGVVFVGSMDPQGHMFALDAATGNPLWSYKSGGSVICGPAVVDGVVYWGSGYKRTGGTGNNALYAFALNK